MLSKKAKAIRKVIGHDIVFAPHEQDKKSAGHLWKVSMVRPFVFLFTEPITYLTAAINGYMFSTYLTTSRC